MSGLGLRLRTVTLAQREPRRPANWLVLACLAGGQDLTDAGRDDLGQMERVGSHPGAVEILAQVDGGPGQDPAQGTRRNTRRYHVTRAPVRSRVLADLGPTSAGDPAVIESFIRFATARRLTRDKPRSRQVNT